jgi:hypothetical protein
MHLDSTLSMSTLEISKLILTVISGVCWTIVYIEGIRIGFRDKSYAIPFYALALNFAWEGLYTFFGFRINGVTVQNIFNAVWLIFDIGILYTYFKFGQKYFLRWLRTETSANGLNTKSAFTSWSVLGLVTAFALQYAILREFGIAKGAGYSAFLQNLLMSVLFISMLAGRGTREGQSLSIAINKWIGTLAPTILYGFIGEGGFPRGSFLILVAGILCTIFDLIYIRMLFSIKGRPHRIA